jgi:PAS domain S-box-containing protein
MSGRERDERLRIIIDALPAAVAYVDADGRYRFVNSTYAARHGRMRADLVGHSIAEILGPARYQRARPSLDAAFAGTKTSFDVASTPNGGQLRHETIQFIPDRDAEGAVRGIILVIDDTSEQKRGEAERADLRRREDRTRLESEAARRRAVFLSDASELLSSSLDYEATLRSVARIAVPGIADWCAVDIVSGDGTIERLVVAHADPAKERLAQELLQRYPLRTDAHLGVPNVIRTGVAELQPAVPDAILERAARSPEDLRLLRSLGLKSVAIAPLQARGRVLGAITLATADSGREYDNRDLALAEEIARRAALAVDNSRLYREAERRRQHAEELARLARRLAESLDVTAVSERIVESVLTLFGAASAVLRRLRPDRSLECLAVAGRRLGPSYQPGYVLPSGEGLVGRVVATGASMWTADIVHDPNVELTDEFREALDRASHRAVLAVPLRAKGEIIGALSIADSTSRSFSPSEVELLEAFADEAALALSNAWLHEDVQQRGRDAELAREGAEAANRAKDEFLAVLSHELRTPLTAMLGWVRMLRSGQLDPIQAGRAMEAIERNTRLQAQLINDLLDVSRIVAGKLELDRYPVDLEAIIGAALESLRRDADSKGLRVDAALDSGVGPVWGDPVRLNQVMVNLISNAIKFTPSGGRIEVRLDQRGSRARVRVADSGVGIEPDVLPYIFDRFRQADSSHRRGHGGLGLGLAIVRQLVELHGGSVKAESEGRNRGTTFVVELPVMGRVSRRAVTGTAAGQQPALVPPRLDGVHVLVVDDEADARELVQTVLERCGARVSTAASADEALESLASAKVDVLISDIGMPGTDGYDLIARVRRGETASRLPAIALTAYASAEDRARAMAAGFDSHAVKPIDPAALAEIVASEVRNSGERSGQ